MYSTILVPIDTSHMMEHGYVAPLELACKTARESGGRVYLLSVVPSNLLSGYYPNLHTQEVIADTRRKLEAIVEECCPDVSVEVIVAEGGIGGAILRTATDLSVDLIVMTSHDPVLRDYVLGSRAAHVALHASCTVFVVRETQQAA